MKNLLDRYYFWNSKKNNISKFALVSKSVNDTDKKKSQLFCGSQFAGLKIEFSFSLNQVGFRIRELLLRVHKKLISQKYLLRYTFIHTFARTWRRTVRSQISPLSFFPSIFVVASRTKANRRAVISFIMYSFFLSVILLASLLESKNI